MTKHLFYLRFALIIGIFNLLFSSEAMAGNKLPNPVIKAGTAKLSGSISNMKLSKDGEELTAKITVYNPITGESSYKTTLDKENQFSIDVPLQCTRTIAILNVSSETMYYCICAIGLEQEKETQINISFDDKDEMKISAKGGLDLSADEMTKMCEALRSFEMNNDTPGDYHKMTPKEFADYNLNNNLKKRMSVAMDSIVLSERIKNNLINSFNLRFLKGRLFYYKECAEESFERANNGALADYKAVEPDKEYYSFLSKYNLNDPQYLYCYSYHDFMKAFLVIKAFNIPKIGNTPVEEWLKGVKNSVKNVVGFNSGMFYDMLAANAYDQQMSYGTEALTNKQLANIRNYFKADKKAIGDILLKKNEETVKTLESNKDLKVNKTPAVTKEKLMEAIIAKYKGKVVLVDFWATWCGPCVSAFKEMKPLKNELKGKDVVFVYITSASSPKERWEGQIKQIGGEHYYLTKDEMNYLRENLDFGGIPTYLIYDTNGVLKNKVTGFPGNNSMLEMINSELP